MRSAAGSWGQPGQRKTEKTNGIEWTDRQAELLCLSSRAALAACGLVLETKAPEHKTSANTNSTTLAREGPAGT